MGTIFIGWSGYRSRRVAEFLRDWLQSVFDATAAHWKGQRPDLAVEDIHVWMSTQNIDSGTDWRDELNEALRRADYGIICVTSENREAPYITYEAGALANKRDEADARARLVCPYLIDLYLSEEDLPLTLNQFAGAMADADGTRKLVRGVCGFVVRKNGLSAADAKLWCEEADRVADREWPRLGAKLAEVQGGGQPQPGTLKDIVDEDRKLTGDFKKVRGLIDAHESNVVGRLTPVVRLLVSRHRKDEPIDLDAVTARVYEEIEANLDEAMTSNGLPPDAQSMTVGGVRQFFIDQFRLGELHRMLEHEFKPILEDDLLSSEAKTMAMVELLMVRKNQVFSRLHRVLAAKFADYLERE